jgi:hypothetical protein
MPQASTPDQAGTPAGREPSRPNRDSQDSNPSKPGLSSIVSRLTFFRELYPSRTDRVQARKIVDLEPLESFDLDTLEAYDARISTDKSRGAGVRRTAVFKEGRVAEVLAGYWPSISRGGRFFSRSIHRGRYREVLTREEILQLEDAVSAHIARAIEEFRAQERELADILSDFGIGACDIESAKPKRCTTLIDNPMQSMAMDLALAADSVAAQLRVLDSLYYRRGLTRSESSERTQEEIRRAMHRLDGALRFVFRVAQRARSYCERTADAQFEQVRRDERRREQRRAQEEAARARERQASEARVRKIRAESDALWAGIEKERKAEQKERQARARKAAADAIEKSRQEAEEAFGPIAGEKDSSGTEPPLPAETVELAQ